MNTINKKLLIKYYQNYKLNTRLVGKILKVCHVTILHWLKKFNIPIRTKSEVLTGRIMSKASRLKMSIAHKGIPYRLKGKSYEEIHGKKEAKRLKTNLIRKQTGLFGIFSRRWTGGYPICKICGNRTKSRYSKICSDCFKGPNTPNWHEGISFLPYSKKFTPSLKLEIRTRDNFTCQCCQITEKEHLKRFKKVLTIHHINYNKLDCSKENLITVCHICNNIANGQRDYWYAYYKYIMENFITIPIS